ncbi:MAG TPA: hypothetical protein VGV87_27895, partial [Blastocatellia bacterium]|nr:hypothetical protein [Blastocatellia bacterium]
KHWTTALLVACSSLFLLACHAKQQRAPEPAPSQKTASVPEITSESEEEDFHDLVFKLGDIDQLSDGGQRFIATGTHHGNAVEVEVNLRHKWTADRMGDETIYMGSVTIRSLGAGSDSLLRAMDEIYETQLNPKRMAEATEFSAISLGGDPTYLRSGPVELKLFFESELEDGYAEMYLNIDAAGLRVVLAEKDPDYRKAVVLALTSKVK